MARQTSEDYTNEITDIYVNTINKSSRDQATKRKERLQTINDPSHDPLHVFDFKTITNYKTVLPQHDQPLVKFVFDAK